MIRLTEQPITQAAQTQLRKYQQTIDDILDYAGQVAFAKTEFGKRNKTTNRSFKTVKKSLTTMCSGSRRCMYCEDSCADEVEHIQPKDLYPDVVFAWSNYLYSCGPCNGGKNNKYALIAANDDLLDITRKRNQPIIRPPLGDHALINPRLEDPMLLLAIDLRDTFNFVPFPAISTRQQRRAQFTIDVLELNRDILPPARKDAYGSFRARLREYISLRDNGSSPNDLETLVMSLKRLQHPTVWHEMKRQHNLIPELKKLFTQAPEALGW